MLEFTRSVPTSTPTIGGSLARYVAGRVLRSRLGPRIGDRPAVYLSHFVVHGRLPNLREQKTFSERIAFRRLCPQPIFTPLSDKIEVRGYVRDRVGEACLIPLLAVTTEPETFRFDRLPGSYMMKANHGCGWNEVVLDNTQADIEALRARARTWLGQNFARNKRERHYGGIRPRIMFETLLQDGGRVPKDYKVHCFRRNGQLRQIIQVHCDRFGDHRVNFFTPEWEPIPFSHGYASAGLEAVPRPANLDAMLGLSARLADPFNYVRVDLYSLGERIFFGELTFTPGAGLMAFNPSAVDAEWAGHFDPDPSYFNDGGTVAGLDPKPGIEVGATA